MKAKQFEQQFDEGVDLTASLDLHKAKRVLQAQKRVNVDFPAWMVDSLDREASRASRGERFQRATAAHARRCSATLSATWKAAAKCATPEKHHVQTPRRKLHHFP